MALVFPKQQNQPDFHLFSYSTRGIIAPYALIAAETTLWYPTPADFRGDHDVSPR